MRTPPADLTAADVVAAVREGWALRVDLAYAPVGFGSHHWVEPGQVFVTVDEVAAPDAAARLDAAMRTAHTLRHEADLAFVVAPLPAVDGDVTRRLGRWSVSVFPYVAGAPLSEEPDDGTRLDVLHRLRALQEATGSVEGIAGADDLVIEARADLERLLRDPDRPWGDGPYAARARDALLAQRGAVVHRLGYYDELVDEARSSTAPWVVTHGEPKPDNWLQTAAGPVLVDWDTALIAPAARDRWWWVPTGASARCSRDDETHELWLYELRWELTDLALYARALSGPHEDDADSAIRWQAFEAALASRRWDLRGLRRPNPQ